MRPAARFPATPTEPRYTAAQLGQHNDEILESLGRTPADIEKLRASGVIR